MSNNIYQPYTYLIGWSKLNTWYYGVRYGKKSNPNDLWITYFTSSKYVKEFREKYGEPDFIQIRQVFKESKNAIKCEDKVIRKLKLYSNPAFLNKAYSGSIYYDEDVRAKISNSRKGKKSPHLKNKSKDHIEKMRKTKTGIKQTQEHKNAVSKALKIKWSKESHHSKNKKLSEQHKKKISEGIRKSEKWQTAKEKGLFATYGMKNKKHSLESKTKMSKKAFNRKKACCIICHKPKDKNKIHDGIPVSNLIQHHKNCKKI